MTSHRAFGEDDLPQNPSHAGTTLPYQEGLSWRGRFYLWLV